MTLKTVTITHQSALGGPWDVAMSAANQSRSEGQSARKAYWSSPEELKVRRPVQRYKILAEERSQHFQALNLLSEASQILAMKRSWLG